MEQPKKKKWNFRHCRSSHNMNHNTRTIIVHNAVVGGECHNLCTTWDPLQEVCHSEGWSSSFVQWIESSWLLWRPHCTLDVATTHYPALHQAWSVWVANLGNLQVDVSQCCSWCYIQWFPLCLHSSLITAVCNVSCSMIRETYNQ